MKGRRTEIEFLNGFVVREGEKVGLACSANAVLTDIVKRVERGELKPGSAPHHRAAAELSGPVSRTLQQSRPRHDT